MKCHRVLRELNNLWDDDLPEEKKTRIQHHLDRCESCSEESRALASVIARANSLPAEVSPERDLWPEIEANLDDRESESVLQEASFSEAWIRFTGIAAALVLLVVLGFSLRPLGPTPSSSDMDNHPGSASSDTRPASVVESTTRKDLDRLRGDIRRVLDQQQGLMDDETLGIVEKNLALIDQAIDEISRALEKDPSNKNLNLLLATQLQREAEIVQHLSQL